MAESQNLSLDGLAPEEASRIIHSHRKVRYGTACWPCRQRKVKCDNQQPCENCVKRDHAQLCSYKPNRPSARQATDAASSDSGGGGTTNTSSFALVGGKKRTHSPDGNTLEAAGSPINVASDVNDVSRYLGENSIPVLLREQASPNQQEEGVEYIRQDMQSILGLDNSAPFPLMSSQHLHRLTVDISAELPSDREVMKLFRAYKEIPHPFWGFVLDLDDLESKLMVYLEDRARNAKRPVKTAKPVSASWLAILFAVMAVGSQYHESPYHIRTQNAHRYMQISFHFLRVGNFLLRPNLDSIQALLMAGFVLLNDMKAEASWALLGLTTRLAQSLGLDRSLPPRDGGPPPKKDHERKVLWWTIVWHDCLTSLSFDRSPMTSHTTCPIPLGRDPAAAGWSYLEGMYHLCQFIGKRLAPEAVGTASYAQILADCQTVEALRTRLLPQLRSKDACRSAIDRLHYFAFRLHTSFLVSVCCRPALRRGGQAADGAAEQASRHTDGTDSAYSADSPDDGSRLTTEQKQVLAAKCKENLTETVRMFLAMHQLSVIPTRSWAFTYHGLSSAVLLGILGETKADLEVRGLQGELIDALSATAAKEQKSPRQPGYRPAVARSDRDIELSGPLSRALTALKNIYDHGSVAGQVAKKKATGRSGGPSSRHSSVHGGGGGGGGGSAKSSFPTAAGSTMGPSLAATAAPAATAALQAGRTAAAAGGPAFTSASTPTSGSTLRLATPDSSTQSPQYAAVPGVGVGRTSDIKALAGFPAGGDLQPGLDPHQDAALAMAELQNGALDLALFPTMQGQSQQPTSTMADLSNIDPTAYLSPMDLYDQIFWETPEPWDMTASDSLNFDFMAQPPPGQTQQQFYF